MMALSILKSVLMGNCHSSFNDEAQGWEDNLKKMIRLLSLNKLGMYFHGRLQKWP